MSFTANQSIKPVTYKRNDNNEMEIGGCSIKNLINQFGSPLYIYDYDTILSIINDYKQAFEGTSVHMMYASKAFMTQSICQIMKKEGFGLDCVSSGEIYTAYSTGFDMKKIVFNGNNKTIDELKYALDKGVGLFSVDNFLEAKRLDNLCRQQNITVNILLRITPGIECHTHEYIQTGHLDCKFGFDLTQIDEIVNLIKNEYQNLKLIGLHAHLGSQIFETDVYRDAIKIIMQEARRIKDSHNLTLNTFNIGGGVGVKYTNSDNPPSIYEIADVIKNALKKYSQQFQIEAPQLFIEPGRSIICTSGVTVYTVGSTKQVPNGNKYVSVDGGMADNIRPALYDAEYVAEVVNDKTNVENEIVTIAGRYCESGDILIKGVNLPKLFEGDLLCIYNTGAYCYSMASNYNRVLKPAAVIVKDGVAQLIIKRQTFEQLVESDCIAEILK